MVIEQKVFINDSHTQIHTILAVAGWACRYAEVLIIMEGGRREHKQSGCCKLWSKTQGISFECSDLEIADFLLHIIKH